MKMARWIVPCVVMGLLLPLVAFARDSGRPAALAQGPLGGRITISSLPEQQKAPAVAYNAVHQEFLVVWWNDRPGNDDIYAQRTDRNGQPVGPWFAIAWGEGMEQHDPDVVWNSRRNEYLVVWVRDDVIYYRRVGPTGHLLGSEFRVNSATQFSSFDPAVAYASTSDAYLVVWVYQHVAGGYVQHSSIVGRLLSSDGQPQGGQFYISQDTQGNARWAPELAYNHSRNEHLVVWQQWDIFAAHDDVRGRRVTGNGDLLFPASIGIATGPEQQLSPAVAAIPTGVGEGGRYLVTWVQAGAQNQVLAQRLDADTNLQGSSILLGLVDPFDYGPAAVYGNEHTRAYLAAWRTTYSQPFLGREIHAREITMDGALVGGEEVLDGTGSHAPDVAAGDGSTFLIVYQEQVEGNRDIWGQLWGQAGPAPTSTPTSTSTATRTGVPPSPTVTPTGVLCPDILPHGDFEGGLLPPWNVHGGAQWTAARAHSGTHSVRLGGTNNAVHDLSAAVGVSTGAEPITLSYWWYVESTDPNPEVDLMVVLAGGTGGEIEVGVVHNGLTRDAWRYSSHDLTGYPGQLEAVIFHSETDGANVTTFYVDDVRIQACRAPVSTHLIYLPVVLKLSG